MAIINNGSISRTELNTAFNALFQRGLGSVSSIWQKIATLSSSSTSEEKYPWLGEIPGMREWIGERQIKGLSEHGYSIKNRKFENTIAVPVTAIDDNQYVNYQIPMQAMGEEAARHPDKLVFESLLKGFETKCFDGQNFFDEDHPVIDVNGKEQSVSNKIKGNSTNPWFLLDTSRFIKPLIYQERKKPRFVTKDQEKDDNVFFENKYVYGVDYRGNAGYSFWQLAFGVQDELSQESFKEAYLAMTSFKKDYGEPLPISPNLLVVGPSLRFTAQNLITLPILPGGGTNPLYGMLEVLVVPYLP